MKHPHTTPCSVYVHYKANAHKQTVTSNTLIQTLCVSIDVALTGSFTLAELGLCEPPSQSSTFHSDLDQVQHGYALSAGSDLDNDSDPEEAMTPERAVRMWAGRDMKSRCSSGLSSRENSALTLTDSEHEHKSEDESGKIC